MGPNIHAQKKQLIQSIEVWEQFEKTPSIRPSMQLSMKIQAMTEKLALKITEQSE